MGSTGTALLTLLTKKNERGRGSGGGRVGGGGGVSGRLMIVEWMVATTFHTWVTRKVKINDEDHLSTWSCRVY